MSFRKNDAGIASEDETLPSGKPKDALPDGHSRVLVVVRRMRHVNAESGFFIAEAELADGDQDVQDHWIKGHLRSTKGRFSIKGTSSLLVKDTEDPIGKSYECLGVWSLDPTYGPQLDVQTVLDQIPSTPEALRHYFKSGRIRGIGPSTADAMMDQWGMDVIRILDHTPERLLELPRMTPDRMQEIANAWKSKRETYAFVAFLGQHGIGEVLALRAMEALSEGEGTGQIEARIRANPYILSEVEGIGFGRADSVALSLGFEFNSRERQEAALRHYLSEQVNSEGHTAIPLNFWLEQSASLLNTTVDKIRPLAQVLLNEEKVIARQLPVRSWNEQKNGWDSVVRWCVSPRREFWDEVTIAKEFMRLMKEHPAQPFTGAAREKIIKQIDSPERRLDQSQKRGAFMPMQSPVSILTGGPGTGKTTTLRTVVQVAQEQGISVVLAAPTGRAAKRMEEAIGVPASTIHRLLGFGKGEGDKMFKFGSHSKLSGDFFILDEVSMIDHNLLRYFLEALPNQARLLMVGDFNQLPSVGPGDALKSLLESKCIPFVKLERIHRQESGSQIAETAARILAGKMPEEKGHALKDEYAFVRAGDNPTIIAQIKTIIRGLIAQGVDPNDIQILTPEKGKDVGTDALNWELRELLNPDHPGSASMEDPNVLVVGERMMVVKNDYQLEVFNGDLGRIHEIRDDGSITLLMEGKEGRMVTFEPSKARQLQLAYARTIHKSQGGEHPVVIIPMSRSHMYSFTRSLLYTGGTRAKKKLRFVGDPSVAAHAVKRVEKLNRITGLIPELLVQIQKY